MIKDTVVADTIGEFREMLGLIAEEGPNTAEAKTGYQNLRGRLLDDPRVVELVPDFVVECRTSRDFWNYIMRAYGKYSERTQYIEAQLLPIERQFRPERQRAPGTRPPEVRIEYSPIRSATPTRLAFVADERLSELRTATSSQFDLSKLLRLCEELNVAYKEGCFFSTALLVRTLLDHVPPIFGKRLFTEVANNYGSKSFKDSMLNLQNSARKIADGHLHCPIRPSETLPVAQQVNFSADVDVLLGEIVRVV